MTVGGWGGVLLNNKYALWIGFEGKTHGVDITPESAITPEYAITICKGHMLYQILSLNFQFNYFNRGVLELELGNNAINNGP